MARTYTLSFPTKLLDSLASPPARRSALAQMIIDYAYYGLTYDGPVELPEKAKHELISIYADKNRESKIQEIQRAHNLTGTGRDFIRVLEALVLKRAKHDPNILNNQRDARGHWNDI